MMAEWRDRIFRRRCPVRVRCRTHSRVSHRSKIEREQAVFPDFQVVKSSQLHNEIVRVLAIDDWFAKRSFSLLKQFWVEPPDHRAWFKAQHCAHG